MIWSLPVRSKKERKACFRWSIVKQALNYLINGVLLTNAACYRASEPLLSMATDPVYFSLRRVIAAPSNTNIRSFSDKLLQLAFFKSKIVWNCHQVIHFARGWWIWHSLVLSCWKCNEQMLVVLKTWWNSPQIVGQSNNKDKHLPEIMHYLTLSSEIRNTRHFKQVKAQKTRIFAISLLFIKGKKWWPLKKEELFSFNALMTRMPLFVLNVNGTCTKSR